MFKFIALLEIYLLVLLCVIVYVSVFNNLGMVLVLHRRLPSWSLALPDTYVATHLRQEVGSHSGTGWVATHG